MLQVNTCLPLTISVRCRGAGERAPSDISDRTKRNKSVCLLLLISYHAPRCASVRTLGYTTTPLLPSCLPACSDVGKWFVPCGSPPTPTSHFPTRGWWHCIALAPSGARERVSRDCRTKAAYHEAGGRLAWRLAPVVCLFPVALSAESSHDFADSLAYIVRIRPPAFSHVSVLPALDDFMILLSWHVHF